MPKGTKTHGPAFQYCVTNLADTPVANNPGTAFSSGASNADGATTAVLTALATDIYYIVIKTGLSGTAGEDNSALANIIGDPAGGTTWSEIIVPNIIVGTSQVSGTGSLAGCEYHFNRYIPAGMSLGIFCRKTGATADTGARVVIAAYGKPKYPKRWTCGAAIEALGIDAANSKGTAHTPGDTGVYSSYATIGTSTKRYVGLQLGVQTGGTTLSARGYNAKIGVSSAQMPGTHPHWWSVSTAELGSHVSGGPMHVDLPSGTALQISATCSGTAAACNAAFYGVY